MLTNLFLLGMALMGIGSPSDYQFYHDGNEFSATLYYENGGTFVFHGDCENGWQTSPPIELDYEVWCGVVVTSNEDVTEYSIKEMGCSYVVELQNDRWDSPSYPFCNSTELSLRELNGDQIPELQLFQNGWQSK